MTTLAIRKKLSDYLQVADDKKIKAIYALVEDDLDQPELEYTDDLKTELDIRLKSYKKNGKLISGELVKNQMSKLLK